MIYSLKHTVNNEDFGEGINHYRARLHIKLIA